MRWLCTFSSPPVFAQNSRLCLDALFSNDGSPVPAECVADCEAMRAKFPTSLALGHSEPGTLGATIRLWVLYVLQNEWIDIWNIGSFTGGSPVPRSYIVE